ncbi:MAG: ExbD/TolR family protein [Phycisphaeraceae bacterium]
MSRRRRKNKSKRRKVLIPVASMGDIVFMLIIFFILASEFDKTKDLDLELTESGQVKEPEFPIAARVAIDAEGQLYFNGELMDSIKSIEYAVSAKVLNAETDAQRRVEFKCDKNLRKDQFEPVLKAIAEGGGIIEDVAQEIKNN